MNKGPKPQFDRWTYWEKFDFLAVFWGMFAIGLSGLMLWFPEFFTIFLPGWILNIATIVHSDEALLASGFIFTVHFFNTHFRPSKFPIDTVIFTGRIPKYELVEERPEQYKRMMAGEDIGDLSREIPKRRGRPLLNDYGICHAGHWASLRLPDCVGIPCVNDPNDSE